MCYKHNKITALCKLIIRELGQRKNVLKKIVKIPSMIDFSLSILYDKEISGISKHIILISLI